MEKQLTSRLKVASEAERISAFEQTFQEVIKRDTHFGSLLLKIKQAYDDYLRKLECSAQNTTKHEDEQVERLQSKLTLKEQEAKQTQKKVT